MLGISELFGTKIMYEDFVQFKNLCEFCRFFLCDFLGPKCFDTCRPKFFNTLRPKCFYSSCKQYI